ncbi:hypothetical protein [Lutimonas sp.]|uniref:HzsA-related protein n=1 Tax=Lutimonas sp. TaxID=1872403 RepID=UPI003D9BFBD8
MKQKVNRWIVVFLFPIIVSGWFLTSCDRPSTEGMLILTQVDKNQNLTAFNRSDSFELPDGAKIVMIDPENLHRKPLQLTKEFYSACSPDLSFDARSIVFAGQKNEDDPWQIYEMNLTSLAFKPLTSGTETCLDPIYLPGDRIMYTKDFGNQDVHSGGSMFVLSAEKSIHQQITFSPAIYRSTALLHDGRVLSIKTQLPTDNNTTQLMVMRPDGTKEMLFYESEDGGEMFAKGRESNDEVIYLLEKNQKGAGHLFSLSYNNPLKGKKELSERFAGDFIGINQLNNGLLLACYKESPNGYYHLFELDPNNIEHFKPVYKNSNYSTIEVVSVEKRKAPKNIPSEVDLQEKTALLLCQDVNFIGMHQDSLSEGPARAVKLEVLGLENSLGIVDVEKDGSVYLKIAADTPFKLQTLDDQGGIISGPSSWINLRPNERRACVGCHQGNEVVPLNRQPLSVLKEPVLIPSEPTLLAGRE